MTTIAARQPPPPRRGRSRRRAVAHGLVLAGTPVRRLPLRPHRPAGRHRRLRRLRLLGGRPDRPVRPYRWGARCLHLLARRRPPLRPGPGPRLLAVPLALGGSPPGDPPLARRPPFALAPSPSRRSPSSSTTATSTSSWRPPSSSASAIRCAWAFVLLDQGDARASGSSGSLVRREWRALATALGRDPRSSSPVSLVVDGRLWLAWLSEEPLRHRLRRAAQPVLDPDPSAASARMPAAAIVTWGARTDRRWTVPLAATLALPVLWPSGLAVLAALWGMTRRTW
ncbi:MAG: hypothetical protein KatS3mg065_0870 [Chloroflexota bacterium]|nr:MAG: hypothetical protein KatS3mg065_0870 [Chloroflexota bacterium]